MSPLWRLTLIPQRTIFSFDRKLLWPLSPNQGPPIPRQELVDEEICPGYNLANFYPAKPGEVLTKKFQQCTCRDRLGITINRVARPRYFEVRTSVTVLFANFMLTTEELTMVSTIKIQMAI